MDGVNFKTQLYVVLEGNIAVNFIIKEGFLFYLYR